jgi:hypothetical protein
MECVEGETLAGRLAEGALTVEQTLTRSRSLMRSTSRIAAVSSIGISSWATSC